MKRGERYKAKCNGAVTYSNGKPCTKGHVAPRYTSSGACTVCASERGPTMVEVVCETCGAICLKKTRGKSRDQRYCSSACFGKSIAIMKTCEFCGLLFYNWNNKRFCSMKCSGESRRGKPLSDKHVKSLKAAKKGTFPHHLFTEEALDKQRRNHVPLVPRYGKDHHNWNPNRHLVPDRRKPEYAKWRAAILERDDYTCQLCGKRGGKIIADHIKPYALFPELRFDLSNGRVLCVACHKTTETYGGKTIKLRKEMDAKDQAI